MTELDTTLDALFGTLQRAEYRVPYTPLARWPLYECAHEWLDISTFGQAATSLLCKWCGEVRR